MGEHSLHPRPVFWMLLLFSLATPILSYDWNIQCSPFPDRQPALPLDNVLSVCVQTLYTMIGEEDYDRRMAWQTYQSPDPDKQLLPVEWGEEPTGQAGNLACEMALQVDNHEQRVREVFPLQAVTPLAFEIIDQCLINPAGADGNVKRLGGSAILFTGGQVKFYISLSGNPALANGTVATGAGTGNNEGRIETA